MSKRELSYRWSDGSTSNVFGITQTSTKKSSYDGPAISSQASCSDTYEFSFPSGMFASVPRKRSKLTDSSAKNQRGTEMTLAGRYKFTLTRMRKEEFRRRIVDIIIKPGLSDGEDSEAISEKELARFYHYIQNGLDTLYVAPIESATLRETLSLIPEKYKSLFAGIVEDLLKEIGEEFLWTMKKSIVDFALQDPLIKNKSTVSFFIN